VSSTRFQSQMFFAEEPGFSPRAERRGFHRKASLRPGFGRVCWKRGDGTGAVTRVPLLPPPRSPPRQAELRAPASSAVGNAPALGHWARRVAAAAVPGCEGARVLTGRGPAPLQRCRPAAGTGSARGFASAPLRLPHLPQPLLIYFVIYGARDGTLRSL